MVHIEEVPPKADVVFAFDLTGSMGGIIGTAKAKAALIIASLDAIPDVAIQYGVMSYMDYPHSYSSCGYSAEYGTTAWGCGDYAYRLDQAVTGDSTAVIGAINALTLGCGSDGPQDYTRIMYESYADPSVEWRTGAKRILVNFGDNVPHDCNLNEEVPGKTGTWSTGGDPGRDEVMGTADDLDLQTALAAMDSNGVVLLECHTSAYANEYWAYWTGITGGGVYLTSSDTLVDDIVTAVEDALEVPMAYSLHLEISPGFESWLESVSPPSYPEVEPCNTVEFEVTIRVPEGTEDGEYNFTISAVDEDGVSHGDQQVTITVVSIIEVGFDIKPGSCPNPFNTTSKGVLPVAVLGSEDFDVTTVDPATIRLTREGYEDGVSPLRWSYEDVATPFEGELCECHDLNGDGYMDLTLKFKTQEIKDTLDLNDEAGNTIPLLVTGNLMEEADGTPIEGSDCIWVLAGKK
jgi:hypothetical protein